jgi:ATP-dependent protease ClpP protease subunit
MQFESKDGEATLWVYDPIGDMFGPDAVSAKGVRDRLASLRGISKLTVRINSPGGMVDDAIAIRSLLSDHESEKVFKIDGVAASAATVLFTDGAKVKIAPGASMMIHNPWSIAVGDGNAMRKAAEVADKYRDNIASIYSRRTGKSMKDILAAMASETWFTSDEAVAWGMADGAEEGGEAIAFAKEDTAKIISYAKEVARIAAMALVADAGSDSADAVAAKALEIGRKINAANRSRQIELMKHRRTG